MKKNKKSKKFPQVTVEIENLVSNNLSSLGYEVREIHRKEAENSLIVVGQHKISHGYAMWTGYQVP